MNLFKQVSLPRLAELFVWLTAECFSTCSKVSFQTWQNKFENGIFAQRMCSRNKMCTGHAVVFNSLCLHIILILISWNSTLDWWNSRRMSLETRANMKHRQVLGKRLPGYIADSMSDFWNNYVFGDFKRSFCLNSGHNWRKKCVFRFIGIKYGRGLNYPRRSLKQCR